jgi:zinc transporter 1/2/3
MIREKFQAVFRESSSSTVFPVAEFTTCIGFFLVLVFEQIIHSFHESSLFHGHGHGDAEARAPLLNSSAQNGHVAGGDSSDSFATRTAGVHVNSGTQQQQQHQTEGSIRTYILVFALSLHSVFEGLALGLIVELDRLVQIAVAVMIHKSIIAFSLGVSMVQHQMGIRTILKAAVIFSIMGPIGIGIGIGVLDSSSQFGSNLASGILQGIANGTFLFVTFFEILQSELSRKGNRLLKVLFMIIGYSIVTGLLYYANYLEKKSHDIHDHGTNQTTTKPTTLLLHTL